LRAQAPQKGPAWPGAGQLEGAGALWHWLDLRALVCALESDHLCSGIGVKGFLMLYFVIFYVLDKEKNPRPEIMPWLEDS
jgi:hypothetical protein